MSSSFLSPGTGLTVFLLLTVALLALTVATGLRAKRRLHIPSVVLTVVSLGVTICFARELGELYDLEAGGWVTTAHLWTAKLTTACFVLPIASGWRTLKRPETRPLHRRLVVLVLTLVVATTVLGIAMMTLAEPL